MKPETTTTGVSREAAAGLALLGAAVLALIIANSSYADAYDRALALPLAVGIAPFALSKSLLHWINDALMVIFFFVVGLEIKREMLRGALSNRKAALLPVIAALGGMIVPALIYAAINWNNNIALRGWAIPAATDIAFAVGVLALLGSRVPQSLKVFLLALAIIDDLGAILIIAFFYTGDLSLSALALAFAGVAGLVLLNRYGVMRMWAYALVGAFVWLCVLKSGVHATLAGVVTRDLDSGVLQSADRRQGPRRSARSDRAPTRAVGQLSYSADFRARQRGGFVCRDFAPGLHLADFARHRARPAHRQAARDLLFCQGCDDERARCATGWRNGDAAIRHSHSRRYWLHDEPVHRHAGIP